MIYKATHTHIMENDDILLFNLREILNSKLKEIEHLLSSSSKKINNDGNNGDNVNIVNIDIIDYNTKKTISKINAEAKRKLEASKSYKKKTQIIS